MSDHIQITQIKSGSLRSHPDQSKFDLDQTGFDLSDPDVIQVIWAFLSSSFLRNEQNFFIDQIQN